MEKQIPFILNDKPISAKINPNTVVLDFIRKHENLKGTKEGCREGECGACCVLVGEIINNKLEYKAVASCLLPLKDLYGKHLVTVEGVNQNDLNPIQEAFVKTNATQCGFCTPGIILSLTGFFLNSSDLSFQDAIDSLDGNICRCTGYVSIRNAIKILTEKFESKLDKKKSRISQLIEWEILPKYFKNIKNDLNKIPNQLQQSFNKKMIPIGGGTDLYVQKEEELQTQNIYITSNNSQNRQIKIDKRFIYLGCAITTQELKTNKILIKSIPNIKEITNRISSTLMRNKATIAGNIVNASPIGDLSILLLALKAQLIIKSQNTQRTVPLRKFFKGYKDYDLGEYEIISTIKFPIPENNIFFNFEKVSQRHYLDIATVNTAILLKIDQNKIAEANLAIGGVFAFPLYLNKTSTYLVGQTLDTQTIHKALDLIEKEIAPIDDIRGSSKYKRMLARQLVIAHFAKIDQKLVEPLIQSNFLTKEI